MTVANAFRGEVALIHDGATYTLVLDFNSLCEFEAETGKNALTILDGMDVGEVSAVDLRALMWAGLREHHPDITLQMAGRILSANVNALQLAADAAKPEVAQGNVSRPQRAKNKPR